MTEPYGILDQIVGDRIEKIHRVFYVFDGIAEEDAGALQIEFERFGPMLLDVDADGHSLKVLAERWKDPFDGRMTPENQRFVAESGKWTSIEVGARSDYLPFLGSIVLRVLPQDEGGGLTGVIIEADLGRKIRADVVADDLYVRVY